MRLGDSDRMNTPEPLDPMEWDKAQALENDRHRDHGELVPYPGSAWVTECSWAALDTDDEEERAYFIGEIAMISEGEADEVRRILREGW